MFDERLLDVDALLERPRRILRFLRRTVVLVPMMLALSSANPAHAEPSRSDILSAVNQTGATMATLNDWRAILLVAMILASLMLIGLLAVVGMSFRTISSMSAALGGVRDAIQSNTLAIGRLESSSRQ